MKPWTPTPDQAADLIAWADTRDALDPDSSFFTVLYAELVADAADLAATDPTLSPVGSAAPTIVPHLSVLPHLEMIGGVS